MPIKLITELTDSDRRLVARAVEGFVPPRVFDMHAHLFHTSHFAEGKKPEFLEPDTGYGRNQWQEALARWMPGREAHGLFFGYPSAGNDRVGENRFVAGQVDAFGNDSPSRGLMLVSPEDDPGMVRETMRERGFVGIKPYRLYAPFEDTTQVRIEDFAPDWMWELCDEIKGVLMLHIMRSAGIADEQNLKSIHRLCAKHPRCTLVLAHIARSFSYRNAREGLPKIASIPNLVLDNSAVTEMEAMRCALDTLGPQRVLFGSDYMVSEFRAKCYSMGDGFTWVYADHDELPSKALTSFDSHTLIGIESLLSLREAFEICGFNAADAEDLFWNNAMRALAPHLPKTHQPKSGRGPELWSEARTKISCGTGLLSKRAHLFDEKSWPSYFSRCKGAEVWDLDGVRRIDFTGGVGAILLGHSDPDVNAAVHRRVSLGSYSTLASPEEVTLADTLLELHPWAGKVRFARGGGEALTLAVRIARAASGRSGVAFCGYHGWSDWYLAANLGDDAALDGHLLPGLQPLGVPRELAGTAVPFRYNECESFQTALQRLDGKLAAVVMEPMRSEMPRDGFVHKVVDACHAAGAVFILDEVTSGWRFGFPGAASKLSITPDIAVYAKAMSNGFPCGAIVGRDDVMSSANPSFISSSYWTDGVGPAAALACIRKMQHCSVHPHVWHVGEMLQRALREIASRHPLLDIQVGGMPCSPSFVFQLGELTASAKALCIRGMLSRGFLFSSQLYVMWPHTEAHVSAMAAALDETLTEVSRLHNGGRLRAEAGITETSTGFARLV
jgi:glutamate-1-semialdehyde 2,1-aminomutase